MARRPRWACGRSRVGRGDLFELLYLRSRASGWLGWSPRKHLAWLEPSINGEEACGLADLVLSRRLAADSVPAVAIPRICG
jgi:hypothetical protein